MDEGSQAEKESISLEEESLEKKRSRRKLRLEDLQEQNSDSSATEEEYTSPKIISPQTYELSTEDTEIIEDTDAMNIELLGPRCKAILSDVLKENVASVERLSALLGNQA